MTIFWLKTNSSQDLFLKDRHYLQHWNLEPKSHWHNMWVKDCIKDSFQCVNIDKILEPKKERICSIQFCCNIRNMVFPVQNFINSNAKIFNRICGIDSFSIKVCICYFYQISIFSPNDSPSKTMKNAFYLIKKALFVLVIIKFSYFPPSFFFSLLAIALEDDHR